MEGGSEREGGREGREREGRGGREGGREGGSFIIKLYVISSITVTERPCSTQFGEL